MKNRNMSDMIASSMDSILKNPEYQSMFSPSAVLEKLAFTRVADEDKPTELEVEFAAATDVTEEITTTANVDASCNCGKKLVAGKECKCAFDPNGGCSAGGCNPGCSCGCIAKQAEVAMDNLVKSAFNSLMKASTDLEEAGFEDLSANALILMNDLIVEAKAKKNKKDDKKDDKKKKALEKEKAEAAKAKAKAADAKEKAKAKDEKDKNDARDMKAKMKAKKDKEEAEAEAKAKKLKKK